MYTYFAQSYTNTALFILLAYSKNLMKIGHENLDSTVL